MSTPGPDDFDQIVSGFNAPPQPPYYDPNPYGAAPYAPAAKPGLTKRGKAALGIGAAVLAGGSLITYQSYSAQAANDAAIAKELDLKAQALRLEEMKEKNRANEAGMKTQTASETARQASINSCVDDNKKLVGKGYGSPTYRQVIDDCQAQYGATNGTTSGTNVNWQAAGSSTTTNAGDSADGTINGAPLLGIGALAVLAIWGARKGTKPNPT